MMGVWTHPGAPAPVALLPSRELPESVHFSMARSVHFSVAIDTIRYLVGVAQPRDRAPDDRVTRLRLASWHCWRRYWPRTIKRLRRTRDLLTGVPWHLPFPKPVVGPVHSVREAESAIGPKMHPVSMIARTTNSPSVPLRFLAEQLPTCVCGVRPT